MGVFDKFLDIMKLNDDDYDDDDDDDYIDDYDDDDYDSDGNDTKSQYLHFCLQNGM